MKNLLFFFALVAMTFSFQNCQNDEMSEMSAEVELRPELSAEDLEVQDMEAHCHTFPFDDCTHKTGFIGNEPVTVKVTTSGEFLLENDIAIPREWFNEEAVADDRAASKTGLYLWPNAKVYYQFDASFPTNLRNSFKTACQKWNQYTGIQFIQRTTQSNYIRVFKDGNQNYSYLGYKGGVQNLSLYDANIGVAIHEIGHALGLIHEHQRSDRNSKIWVNPALSNTNNFIRYTNSINYTSFDWNSIMLYRSNPYENSWDMLQLPTYAPFNNSIEYWRGYGSYALPSSNDINAVNSMY